jgi:hypothetical protein
MVTPKVSLFVNIALFGYLGARALVDPEVCPLKCP